MRAKGIAVPADRIAPVSLDGNDVKAHRCIGEARIACRKHRGRTYEFCLLATIDRRTGCRERARLAKAHLDECEAAVVHHDEVDFAAPASKIACDRAQTLVEQETVRERLGPRA